MGLKRVVSGCLLPSSKFCTLRARSLHTPCGLLSWCMATSDHLSPLPAALSPSLSTPIRTSLQPFTSPELTYFPSWTRNGSSQSPSQLSLLPTPGMIAMHPAGFIDPAKEHPQAVLGPGRTPAPSTTAQCLRHSQTLHVLSFFP